MRRDGGGTGVTLITFSMPELSRNARLAPSSSPGPMRFGLDERPPVPRRAPPPPPRINRVAEERVVRVETPTVQHLGREVPEPALAKPRASPPPLPSDVRPSRVTPPPLPAALPVAPVVRPTRDLEMPDFLDGAARHRRILWTVWAVAGVALLAGVIAAIASHYRPM
jgi:hypothetical protein